MTTTRPEDPAETDRWEAEKAARPDPAPTTVDPDLVEVVALATGQHYLSGVNTQAGHELCSCEQWADGGMDEDWDDHLAQVALAALAERGALMPTGGELWEEHGCPGRDCRRHPKGQHTHVRTIGHWRSIDGSLD